MTDQLLQKSFILFNDPHLVLIIHVHQSLMYILKYFFCLEPHLDIRVNPFLNKEIQDLVNPAEIVFCLLFVQEDHHFIRQEIPESYILKSEIFFQILDLFPDIIS